MNKHVKTDVKRILTEYEITRDDDGRLAYAFYRLKYKDPDIFIISNITESITRARRELQRDFPELRGSKYAIRQKHAQKVRAQKSQEKAEREFVMRDRNSKKSGLLAFFGL